MGMNLKGFSLLEVIIVLVILGSLATVAVLQYTGTVEQGRQTEARVILDDIRKSEMRYHQSNSFSLTKIEKPVRFYESIFYPYDYFTSL